MNWPLKLFFAAFLIAAAVNDGTQADATVSGTVFCDQCRDGQISIFDYPLYGTKVAVSCSDSNGQLTMWREETTNWFGNYAMRFEGTPDLSSCYAQVSGSGQGCGAVAGPPRNLKLMFRMFDVEMYAVDPLLSEPARPMSYCPRSSATPVLAPVTPILPPPVERPPVRPRLQPMPPMPFLEASACPYWNWTMPEYKCYWKAVTADTKVAVTFGLVAAQRYGTDMSLGMALKGRGEPYRTLLREATTALLNSYNSVHFAYHPIGVIQDLNWALMGSTRAVLRTGQQFMRANAGYGKVSCKFSPCKGS